MFKEENVAERSAKGNYIISFISEPEEHVRATVYHDGQTASIYFKLKSGFTLAKGEKIVTDKWLSEIFDFLDQNNHVRKFVHLYDQGFF